MNFLSHYYFERDNHNENMVLGVVLPDLVKNAQKDCNLYPHRKKHLFETDGIQNSILAGWERHLKVDNLFHSSDFFKIQTNELKTIILPVFEDSPVKPFFLAHIGLELILDHLLSVNSVVDIGSFYEHLEQADKASLGVFLQNCAENDNSVFFKFLDDFISSRYLFSYQKLENISYALNRICMRLWDNPFNDDQLDLLTCKLGIFKQSIAHNYHSIFNEIEQQLKSGTS